MRWEDERYVRLYTRDTITWKMLPWEGKALLALLFRKVDRAGLIDVGDYGAEGVAALVDLPTEVVTEGLASLIKAKTVQWAENGTVLLLPNFLTAQEAHQSDAQRKRDQRERVVAKAKLDSIAPEMSHGVTESHAAGQIVTTGHTESQLVTVGHSDLIRADLSLSDPNPPATSAGRVSKPRKPPKPKTERPGWPDLVAAYSDAWKALHSLEGKGPVIEGADASALARVYDTEGLEETIALVRRFVSDPDVFVARRGFMLRDLPSRVNAYRSKQPDLVIRGALPKSTSVDDSTRAIRKY